MSEISETEIKAMTKEQNYMRGYKDGKSDVLDKIRAEIAGKKQKINFKGLSDYEKAQVEMRLYTLDELLQIIDKYKAESEDENADNN